MRRPFETFVGVLALSGAVSLIAASHSAAQDTDPMNRAIALYHEGDFETALQALETRMSEAGLEREDLVQVFEYQALAHYGLEQNEEMDQALLRLATLAPDHRLAEAPPPVQAAFANAVRRAGEGLQLQIEPEADEAGVTLVARVENDVAGLSESVRLHGRAPEGSWQSVDGLRLRLPAAEQVLYYGEVLGESGVVLATAGSENDPETWSNSASPGESRNRTKRSPWLWVGIGAAVVAVAGAIVVGIALASNDSRTDVGQPDVDFGQ